MKKMITVEDIEQYCLTREIGAIIDRRVVINEDKFGKKWVTEELRLKRQNFTKEMKEHFKEVDKFHAAYLECGYRRTKDLAEAFMEENTVPEPSFQIFNAINFGKQSTMTMEEILVFAQRNRREPVTDTEFTLDSPGFSSQPYSEDTPFPGDSERKTT